MIKTNSPHSFHIPVMGLGYTIDSPIRVAHYGISSVVSIVDDDLIEKMNRYYSQKFNFKYQEITQKMHDYRAERVTAYLNLMDTVVKQKFNDFKEELAASKTVLTNYLAMLPQTSDLKKGLQNRMEEGKEAILNYLDSHLSPGAIDVNIMTKVDKDNFDKDQQLPIEFNDAHASLRGFANSNLRSSVVLSAGMNPRLYSYFENFDCFFPNTEDQLEKKIILKVSDFRSAMIQGNFLAKKGLWVSEYRIESGLNCGGHAFATEGLLLGPILEEFKEKKDQLIQSAHDLMVKALTIKGKHIPEQPLELIITAQGGVGTAQEHDFLLEHYQLDSIGWGSPFLLVPEATSVDPETRKLLAKAKEEDFYLSAISPLGIPFNAVKGTTNEAFKQKRIDDEVPGSSCPKKFLALSKEYGAKGMCSASKKYQDLKLEELATQKDSFSPEAYSKRKNVITDKSCLCVGLANASYLENDIAIKGQKQGVVVCPGPNLAYFDHEVSLLDMVEHIYGTTSILTVPNRPNLFVNELKMYVDYLRNEIANFSETIAAGQIKKWKTFRDNLLSGIQYYNDMFANAAVLPENNENTKGQLAFYKQEIEAIMIPELAVA
ncbi:hypothetical protein FFWV33_10600 [Flavobacterium faecale]|uniref:Uncharacterized protein n=1 Tax=Flavobacterium faecale TaxID=1355330 RepID=A0A2S1LJE1_9FLAO|nr:hypothetical protein [Flavobacterium faecale]AWG23626.1 hypothetical protein FFWV33_10600 [Flavobacterium faecale]